MKLLDGKQLSQTIKEEIAKEVDLLLSNHEKVPHLAAVLVGGDPASETYVGHKVKACEATGFKSTLVKCKANISEDELLSKIHELNENDDIDGFIVQLPLPDHININKITMAISPNKDVDGFHPENFGKMAIGMPAYLPATPNGIMMLLERNNVETEGKHCVVVGRSNIVGTPMSILLSRNSKPGNCTVTICHSRTKNLASITRMADILIVAIGKLEFITADMVKEGAVVVDVGMHRVEDSAKKLGFRLTGDVAFEEVAPKCSYITPVPGGVGPMTIVSLLSNTLKAAQQNTHKLQP
ncbi:MAG: bifunctional 5,10-methylene-tetrahydrofolate dehydrogenase/5,10-methylene-tetrahydrofolate cyclohydrolase [Bacteroidetes bacterium]|nr:bifunctional 5,10-methylene-tetrahydrofolate dehydrogenase/5,10-methylene-tetrahydrofolate cyclohydrolase [Bacteroidota bacterium]